MLIVIPNLEEDVSQEIKERNDKGWRELLYSYEFEFDVELYVVRPLDSDQSLPLKSSFYEFIYRFIEHLILEKNADSRYFVLLCHNIGGNFVFNLAYLAPHLSSVVLTRESKVKDLPPLETLKSLNIGFKTFRIAAEEDTKKNEEFALSLKLNRRD